MSEVCGSEACLILVINELTRQLWVPPVIPGSLLPERGNPVGVLTSISAEQGNKVHRRSRLPGVRLDSVHMRRLPGPMCTPGINTRLLVGCVAA